MGFAGEYTLLSGTSGIMFFAATDMKEAVAYVSLLCSHYGHVSVTNLTNPSQEAPGLLARGRMASPYWG